MPGQPRGRNQNYQVINFDAWAVAWNQHCAKIECDLVEFEAVYRKTSNQLKSYHQRFLERANAQFTMLPLRDRHSALRAHLQQGGEGAAFADLVGVSVPLAVPRGVGVAGGGAAGGEDLREHDSEMVDVGDDEDGIGGSGYDVGGGGVEVQTQAKATKRKGPPREPQICTICGHRKQQGSYKSAHAHPRNKSGSPSCSVPPGERRPESERTGRLERGQKLFSRCDCAKCCSVDG